MWLNELDFLLFFVKTVALLPTSTLPRYQFPPAIPRVPELLRPRPMAPQITLLPHEIQICSILTATAAAYTAASSHPLTLRIAGGWVRDKLLGLHSDDIDVAIDKMEGLPFATLVSDYMKKRNLNISTVSTIERNLNKGKFLETATARVRWC